jgi:PIN domain nuclease of toxin-antitoxin system
MEVHNPQPSKIAFPKPLHWETLERPPGPACREVLPLDLEVCMCSTELPAIHADPCDRMIIAAAQVHHLPVVTPDPIFAQYGIAIIS